MTRAGVGDTRVIERTVLTFDAIATLGPCRPTSETALETTLETVSPPNRASSHSDRPASPPRLSSFHRRLPRFHRAKASHRPPLALQHRDLEILRTAYDYRLITTPQYLTLFSDESRVAIYGRLQKLFHHGYLDRLGANPNAPLVYALARRGAEVLEVSHRKEGGDRYVAHQLMVGNFRIALTLACREHGIVLDWTRLREDLPVRPDGFFGLRFPWLPDGRNRAFFFLEADRSTMPRERFVGKLRAYGAWHQAGSHTAKLGIRRFRVLTVTRSEERLASLLQATADANALPADRPIFWFTSATRLSAEPRMVFEPIWETAERSGERRSVLPTAVQLEHDDVPGRIRESGHGRGDE